MGPLYSEGFIGKGGGRRGREGNVMTEEEVRFREGFEEAMLLALKMKEGTKARNAESF